MTDHQDPPVRLKGVGDSLWVTVDSSLPSERIYEEITKIFDRLKHLAINAKVVIDTGDQDDSDQLVEELSGFLKSKFQVGHVFKAQSRKHTHDIPDERGPDASETGVVTQNDSLIIAGRVRSGQTIEARKHLVILGDLNPGAEAVAGGDILVLGSLQGKAAAGQPDNINAIVMALEFKPTQIQIAGFVVAGNPRMVGSVPEFAHIENDQIVVNDYMKANPFKRMNWPEER
ncbi:MAG: septum site-determining protein MinC [Desulfobacterales bacterium]|jgi:septum site-determining protein MinC|nr:septum site-determining protein MinC [Desulfobacterales bacterium]